MTLTSSSSNCFQHLSNSSILALQPRSTQKISLFAVDSDFSRKMFASGSSMVRCCVLTRLHHRAADIESRMDPAAGMLDD